MFSSCSPVPLADIKLATENFSKSMIIGDGAEGTVYKGVFVDGQKEFTAAVKRLKDPENNDIRDEINMLSRLSCSHVVSLLGHCQESGEKILIYEYMHNGNLFQKLYGKGRPFLSWEKRLKICIDAAKGLNYLHNALKRQRIIHRDVKTGNILLSETWEAKIADFGLSKKDEVNELQSEIVTKFNRGTPVYQPRELRTSLKLSRATDVYSFGVVLVEMLTREVPFHNDDDDEEEGNIVKWALWNINNGKHEEMIDPELHGQISPKSLKLYLDLVGKCLREIPTTRPVMKEVVEALELALKEHGPPSPSPPSPPPMPSTTKLARGPWGIIDASPKIVPQPSGFGGTNKYHLSGTEDRIVLYYTSLAVIKETFDNSSEVRSILKGYGLVVDERDISLQQSFLKEFEDVFDGGKLAIVPRLFIRGKYVGGADEIKKAHEYGELKDFLNGFSTPRDPEWVCEKCVDKRFLACPEARCGKCNERGLLRCPDCCS